MAKHSAAAWRRVLGYFNIGSSREEERGCPVSKNSAVARCCVLGCSRIASSREGWRRCCVLKATFYLACLGSSGSVRVWRGGGSATCPNTRTTARRCVLGFFRIDSSREGWRRCHVSKGPSAAAWRCVPGFFRLGTKTHTSLAPWLGVSQRDQGTTRRRRRRSGPPKTQKGQSHMMHGGAKKRRARREHRK